MSFNELQRSQSVGSGAGTDESKTPGCGPATVIINHCDFMYKGVDGAMAATFKHLPTKLYDLPDSTTWQDIFDYILREGKSDIRLSGNGVLPTLYYEDEEAFADDAEICKKRFPFLKGMTLGEFKHILHDNLRSVAVTSPPLVLNYVEGICCDEANFLVPQPTYCTFCKSVHLKSKMYTPDSTQTFPMRPC